MVPIHGDSDDLERALQENLRLRRELAAKVEKTEANSKLLRVRRVSHRLAVLLAVLAFLGITFATIFGGPPIENVLLLGAINGAVVGVVVYGLVRLIGWVIGGFAAS